MSTDAQYVAATALMQAVIDKHAEAAPTTEATFSLFQRCLAVVSGEWKSSAGISLTFQVACPSCAHVFSVTAKMPLEGWPDVPVPALKPPSKAGQAR